MGIFQSCEKAKRSKSKKTSVGDGSEKKRSSTREYDGRIYHNEENSSYPFPMDEREVDRLHDQYFVTKELLGCVSCRTTLTRIFRDIMEDEKPNQLDFQSGLEILDLCCGPATWLCETSLKYPSCKFTGVDMSRIWPQLIRPVNLKTVQTNILKGLPFSDNKFDLIQIRFVILSFKEDQLRMVLSEVHRVLKDDGYIQWIDYDLKNAVLGEFTMKFEEFCEVRGLDSSLGSRIEPLLVSNGMNIRRTQHKEIPLGVGRGCDPYLPIFKDTMAGIVPIMKRTMVEDEVDLVEMLNHEINHLEDSKSAVHMHAVLARKKSEH